MFRGYSLIEKQWKYGYLIVDFDNRYKILDPDDEEGKLLVFVVDPDTVEEEIRVRDTNGHRLFEGDTVEIILNESLNIKKQGTIVVDEGCACIHVKDKLSNMMIPLRKLDANLKLIGSHRWLVCKK